MQRAPVLRQAATRTGTCPEDNPSILAFAIWGLDSVGPFKMAPGGYKQILVAMDKFTVRW
jgi:hypothetical protein